MTVSIPVFWKLMMNAALDQVAFSGHKLGVFVPSPPQILPSDQSFFTSARCLRCGLSCDVSWFPGEKFAVAGRALSEDCNSTLRQPAA